MGETPSWADPPPAAVVTHDYAAALEAGGKAPGVLFESLSHSLRDMVSRQYVTTSTGPELEVFDHGPATYLFDTSGTHRAERTVLVVARPTRPAGERDASYQAGYPAPPTVGHRAVDRGHFVPYTGGGLFGPNMFIQDRALNRGWSRQGRLYRALETRATYSPGSVSFVRPLYTDATDIPAFLDVGLLDNQGAVVYRFRNRYDVATDPEEDELAMHLNGATSAQVGALGEETAAYYLSENCDAVIVAMGDAAMPRDGANQDLDLLAIIDGTLIAFEVKTRFLARNAGRRTRGGDLSRPRLRKPKSPATARQGSQEYVTSRLDGVVDIDADYHGVDVRVIAVDFRLMEAQQFAVNDAGTRLSPIGSPESCVGSARAALVSILSHRGYL